MATPNYLFNVERKTKLRRNVFNLGHNSKITGNFGQLIPIDCFPVLPGDTHNVHANIFARMAPAIAPFMHEVNIYTWSFFVPNRLSWRNWEDFITDGVQGPEDPLVGTADSFPKFRIDLHDDTPINLESNYNRSLTASEWIGFVSLDTTPLGDSGNRIRVNRVVFHGGGYGNISTIFDFLGICPIESSSLIIRTQDDLMNRVVDFSAFQSRHLFKAYSSSTNHASVADIIGPAVWTDTQGKVWNMNTYIRRTTNSVAIPDDFPIPSMRGRYMAADNTQKVFGSQLDSAGWNVAPLTFSAIPFDAYLHIWNEYFRDENLMKQKMLLTDEYNQSDIVNPTNGVVNQAYARQFRDLLDKCWEKDYFTSALPWAQRGGAAELPITGIDGAPINFNWDMTGNSPTILHGTQASLSGKELISGNVVGVNEYNTSFNTSGTSQMQAVGVDNSHQLSVNGESVSGPTVNDLRRVVAIQQLLEASARGGSRYIEQILTIFGVRGSDSRFQRPEYLGGGKQPLTVGEVLQTSQSDQTPQGNMSGRGYTIGNKNGFKRYFNEHGYVLTLMAVVPRSSYMQGISKDLFKFDRYDFYWPQFAHLGEQEILRKELDLYADYSRSDSLFGYTPRYAEYKTRLNEIHGEFRTNLDFWHLGRIFTSPPVLNSDFVQINPSVYRQGEHLNRIFAVQDDTTSHFWFDIQFKHRASRLMPIFGTPQLI